MKTAELLQSLTDARVQFVLVGAKDLLDIAALEKIKRGVDPNV